MKPARQLKRSLYAPVVTLAVGATLVAAADPPITSQKLSPRSAPAAGGALFHALDPAQAGVDFINPIDKTHPTKRLYLGAFACGGVAIGDLDGDARPDLFLTSGARPNRLFLQSGREALRFRDASGDAGLPQEEHWSAGATLVDIDADDDLDIYVCNYEAPNQLFVNDGSGRFTEAAKDFGLAVTDASLMASFCDYDLDGDLDCFLLTRDFKRDGGRPEKHPIVKVGNRYEIAPGFEKYYAVVSRGGGKWVYINAGREDYLFRNDGVDTSGQIRFTDVSKTAGISGRDRGNSAAWWDYNNDGLPDIYVGNDFKDPDRLYRNNGDGTFTDVIKNVTSHTPWFSMGSDVADLNGDGFSDLLIADMAGTNHYRSKTTMGEMGASRPFLLSAVPRQYMHNVLYLNQGPGVNRLVDAAYITGLASSDWSWAVKTEDFDGDGKADVFFTNGVSRSFNDSDIQRAPADYIGKTEWDFYESKPPRKERNLAFRNGGGLKFEDVSRAWGLDHLGMSYAAATGDLDGDGDLEMVVANLDEPVTIYRNDSPANTHRVVIRLAGKRGNRSGLGASVTLESGGVRQVRTLHPATGFLSFNDPALSFGLGGNTVIDRLTVRWPTGHVQQFEDLAADHRYTIREPEGKPPGIAKPVRPRPIYANVTSASLNTLIHQETAFDDYLRQPLLPYQHSTLGPGLSWADVDADGDPDCYRGSGKGQAGGVFLNQGRGNFSIASPEAFLPHKASEDLGSLFFDADRDGDPDLYVVSGSVECEPGDTILRDRLYLNDGNGSFQSAPQTALPDLRDSGSCVVAADYDRDGDLDLFVGGRVIPGAYPETPSSRLLRNDSTVGNTKFSEVTAEVSGLEQAGLVTAALWSDANGDGWIDLLICCEWGPVKLFLNREGTLVEATAESGIAGDRGWWKGIAAADLDRDGDIDYVVTNQGLNTPYKASRKKPELLYYGDLDGSGKKRIVEAKFEGSTCYPRRGFSCSKAAMPVLKDQFKTFHNFASQSLEGLYSDSRLDGATKFEATTLSSSVLINDGRGRFEIRPLPPEAQMSPASGVALSDLDGDGNVDCVLSQNFAGAQPEVGWFDAGLGLLLRGRGDGTFAPVATAESGIVVANAATAATLVDLNRDGRPEIAFATSRGPMRILSEPGAYTAELSLLSVSLRGKPGNPPPIGARVTVTVEGWEKPQVMELAAGSGYLSSSEPTLWFGVGEEAGTPVEISVRWPDGTTSAKKTSAGAGSVTMWR